MPREELIALETRPGVTQRFLLIRPKASTAAVILFAGGPGVIGLGEEDGRVTIARDINFLVRSRGLFAERGLTVAVVDAPSDRQGEGGMLGGLRNSMEHVTDIDAVVAWLGRETGLPVWLVGTSRGTESAAYAALRGEEAIAGLVLTSSITVTTANGRSLLDLPLEEVSLAVLIAAHNEDACRVTPPGDAARLGQRFIKAERLEVAMFEGGDEPSSDPCGPLCQHGFLGIEADVVARIAAFIEA